jgi:two-component system chemotaxis response regulator CheY
MKIPIEKNKILVVDDVEVNRILARAYLEMLGWNVDECDGSHATLEYFEKNTPESVLMDIRMPDMDGVELVKILRKTHPVGTVTMVAYTAHAIHEEVNAIRLAGFDEVLIKPITFKDVSIIFKRKT